MLVRALYDRYDHGGDFDRSALLADATYNFQEFGYFGLSLWLAADPWPLGRVLNEKTRKASRVALFRAEALRTHGLTLVASGREPHFDVTDGSLIAGDSRSIRVTAGSAGELVDRFLASAYTVRNNEFFEQDAH